MTRESYVKHLVQLKGFPLKSFAQSIDMPYTTLLSMLKNGLGGAAVDNVIRICKGLDITVEQLQSVLDNPGIAEPFYVSPHEKELIVRYRDKTELQQAVDILLGLQA